MKILEFIQFIPKDVAATICWIFGIELGLNVLLRKLFSPRLSNKITIAMVIVIAIICAVRLFIGYTAH